MFLPITVINDPTLVAVDPIQVQSCKVHKVGIWVQYLRNIFLFTFPFFFGICLNEKHLDRHLHTKCQYLIPFVSFKAKVPHIRLLVN